MEQHDMQRIMVKGVIAELSQEDQEKVKVCAAELREWLIKNEGGGLLALVLVAVEVQSAVFK